MGPAASEQQYRNGLVGTTGAAAAANAAFPRSHTAQFTPEMSGIRDLNEKAEKSKGSKMKLFKPKHIGITREKDGDKKNAPLPSPNKLGAQSSSNLSKVMNASTTSLADTLSSGNTSLYNLNNASTATMVPIEKTSTEKEKSHKTHIFSRKNLKLKDKDDYGLQLSSASSNSRPLDPNAPQSLYSFAPSSPGPNSAFSKSMSGLDLRHGGRALREKKKEEKAAAASNVLEPTYSRDSEAANSEWPTTGSYGTTSAATFLGPASLHASNAGTPYAEALQGFGLHNMTPEDAWDFLKAKLLVVFEGEDVRIAVEDLNRLVMVHVQHCVRKNSPSVIIEDLNDLFQTGFLSLNHTLRNVSDDKLIFQLVNMWLFVFGTVVPFMQAVFLPLDLEFKGHGVVLSTPAAANEFWGAMPPPTPINQSGIDLENVFPLSGNMPPMPPTPMPAGDALDVRHIVLVSFRDTVILPRYAVLKAKFSRLSLESINSNLASLAELPRTGTSTSGGRPATAGSHEQAGGFVSTSYSSQSSTLLGTSGSDPASDLSSANRSRATSNVSNVSNHSNPQTFQSFSSPPTATSSSTSSAQITETVGRMLQCVSVLASVQSGDEAQVKIEDLAKELKLNWLGRGRTGRQRRGFVGTRVRMPIGMVRDGNREAIERDGSPTPTPTRAGTQKEIPALTRAQKRSEGKEARL
ncbi:hypothetical protein UCRPC4_g00995 [Phaeomoniella chlamydospora]|uniref:HbrB-like protein n=1 Tax=Phaeomoniella chlamydospora TaxID=158046 RepID=A0A0G2GWF7_PHACM|nr:hypothetical protein UCRPC4_g00995 [Phaeomoniella chlamydospora]